MRQLDHAKLAKDAKEPRFEHLHVHTLRVAAR